MSQWGDEFARRVEDLIEILEGMEERGEHEEKLMNDLSGIVEEYWKRRREQIKVVQ